jgi:hypothetical protein
MRPGIAPDINSPGGTVRHLSYFCLVIASAGCGHHSPALHHPLELPSPHDIPYANTLPTVRICQSHDWILSADSLVAVHIEKNHDSPVIGVVILGTISARVKLSTS